MQPRLLPAMLTLTLLIGGCTSSQPPRDGSLADQLYPLLNRFSHTGAICSARVVDLSTGRQLYAQGIDEPFMPASNMKLLVAAAALDRFGPDHLIRTYLAFDGANLWIIGTGDPATGDARIAAEAGGTPLTLFDFWAHALRQRNLIRIPGNLYYYDGLLDDEWVHPSWDKASLTEWYAAPVSGLNFNDNCIDISVTPTTNASRAQCEMMPAVQSIHLVNTCFTSPTHAPTIARAANGSTITLGGTCAKADQLASIPVTNPGLFFADALRTRLAAHGITIAGQTLRASTPLGSSIAPPAQAQIAIHQTRLFEILSRMNKYSQNLFAEALIKILGRQHELDHGQNVRGSWPGGSSAIHAFLQKNNIDNVPIVIADGSGLSRYNRVTTRAITDVLAVMAKHPAADAFRASLAVPGQPGTLSQRMQDLQENVFAKTGTLRDVSSLSGYIRTRRGRWLCFSILYNRIPGDEKPYQALQDEACRILAEWNN